MALTRPARSYLMSIRLSRARTHMCAKNVLHFPRNMINNEYAPIPAVHSLARSFTVTLIYLSLSLYNAIVQTRLK